MKNNYFKFCIIVILSCTVYSLKAQSLQKKFQTDMEQRRKHANAVLMKAGEQQAQQQAEKTNGSKIQQQDATGKRPQSTIIQPATTQQQKNTEVKPQLTLGSKRPLTEQKTSAKAPAKKEEINQ